MQNYKDHSKENGFLFEFYCEHCHSSYRTPFVTSQTYAKKKDMQILGVAGAFLGGIGGAAMYAAAVANTPISGPFAGMPPEWHREHEWYLSHAQHGARRYYRQCGHCGRFACKTCYDDNTGLCASCAVAIPATCHSCGAPTEASATCAYCGAKLLTCAAPQPQQANISPEMQQWATNMQYAQSVMQQYWKGALPPPGVVPSQAQPPTAMPCSKCSHNNPPGANNCQRCGAKL